VTSAKAATGKVRAKTTRALLKSCFKINFLLCFSTSSFTISSRWYVTTQTEGKGIGDKP